MRYINFFIFTFIFSALCNATDLPNHYTFPQNYKEGTYTQSFKNSFLVATHDMTDSKFYKSVIILLEHDEKGAIGFVINKSLGDYPLSSLVNKNNIIKDSDKKKLEKITLPIFWGGPLDENKIFVLHSNDYVSKSTKVYKSLSVSNDLQILIDISESNGPKNSLIIIGISAWADSQLEGELERNQWSLGEFDSNLIFKDENKSKWNSAMKRVFVPL
jgi:putative transcriptional regulator